MLFHLGVAFYNEGGRDDKEHTSSFLHLVTFLPTEMEVRNSLVRNESVGGKAIGESYLDHACCSV